MILSIMHVSCTTAVPHEVPELHHITLSCPIDEELPAPDFGPYIICRQFALGQLLPPPPGGARGWTLPQVVERMRRAYCGTLAVELDHLYSSVRRRIRHQLMLASWRTPKTH